jgi:hypothetical protein
MTRKSISVAGLTASIAAELYAKGGADSCSFIPSN